MYSLYRLPSLRWLSGTYLFELYCEDEFVDDQILIVE